MSLTGKILMIALSAAALIEACQVCAQANSANQVNLEARNKTCWDHAMTQLAMNECAAQDYADADAEMNETYGKLLKKYANDAVTQERIKKSQRAWLAFRNAEVDAFFPRDEELAKHGSAWRMCRPLELASLTKDRTKELKEKLESNEGDVCSQPPR